MKLVVLLATTAAVYFVAGALASSGAVALSAALTCAVAGYYLLGFKSGERDASVFSEEEYAVDPSDVEASPAAREFAHTLEND